MILFKTVANKERPEKSSRKKGELFVQKPEILIYGLEERLLQAVSTILCLGGYRCYHLSENNKSLDGQLLPVPILITDVSHSQLALPPHSQKITVCHTRDRAVGLVNEPHFSIPAENDRFLTTVDKLLYQQEGRLIRVCGLQGGTGATTVSFCLAQALQKEMTLKKQGQKRPHKGTLIAVLTENHFSPWLGKLGGVQVEISPEISKSTNPVLARKLDNLIKARSQISHFVYPERLKNDVNGFITAVRKTHQLTIVDSAEPAPTSSDLNIFVGKPEAQSYQRLKEVGISNCLTVWNNPQRSRKHWLTPPSTINPAATGRSFLIPYSAKVFYISQQNIDSALPGNFFRPIEKLAKEILHEHFSS